MRALAAVGVDDDLAAGQAGIAGGASDHEIAGRVDEQLVIALEKGSGLRRKRIHEGGEHDLPDIALDACVHGLDSVELVVLGGQHYGMDAQRLSGRAVIFDGELGLGVGTEIVHHAGTVVADVGQDHEKFVGQCQSQRHVLFGVTAGVAEHHALVARALLLRSLADDAAPDVGALLVYGREQSAALAAEHQLGAVVADAVDDRAGGLLDVDVCVLRADLAADDHKAAAAESLTCDLGVLILTEEFVQDGVRDLVGHLVRVTLRN